MGRISRQTRSELRQLPLMFYKLLGGVLAVVGFTMAVVIVTRKPAPSGLDMVFATILGSVGIIMFLLSTKLLNKYSTNDAKDSIRMNIVSWGLFLLFAALFLACVRLFTR